MTYLLVSPYPSAHRNGVTSYIQNVLEFLEQRGIRTACLSNDDNLPRRHYQEKVRDVITARYSPAEVFVEAPEVQGATRLLPRDYPVHVRLHCPGALVQSYNGMPVDQERLADEIDVVRGARVTSSPSHALLRELRAYLDVSRVRVYKNPPPGDVAAFNARDKTHDVIFMCNLSRVKGADFLNPLLSRLSPRYTAVLAGRYSGGFELSPDVRCRVSLSDHISGPERLRLLGQSRVALTLSRFENCSMMVLEALRVGTIVAGWQVGGHSEIAGPRLIRLVDLGDVEGLARVVVDAVEGPYPAADEFRTATERVRDDFRAGWAGIWSTRPEACERTC